MKGPDGFQRCEALQYLIAGVFLHILRQVDGTDRIAAYKNDRHIDTASMVLNWQMKRIRKRLQK